jgi:hypothetical protein
VSVDYPQVGAIDTLMDPYVTARCVPQDVFTNAVAPLPPAGRAQMAKTGECP